MTKDLLPIGSVVKLHGAGKKLMITGISVQQENDSYMITSLFLSLKDTSATS